MIAETAQEALSGAAELAALNAERGPGAPLYRYVERAVGPHGPLCRAVRAAGGLLLCDDCAWRALERLADGAP